jgi:hypothetical protein
MQTVVYSVRELLGQGRSLGKERHIWQIFQISKRRVRTQSHP